MHSWPREQEISLEQDHGGRKVVGKLSGKLSDTFNYVNSRVKNPSIGTKTFKQKWAEGWRSNY